MKRTILAILAALLTWAIVATLINALIRLALPGYHAAELNHGYTPTMKWARLIMAILTSVAAGAVTRAIAPTNTQAPASRHAPLIVSAILLALFLPIHISIWPSFPVWYHLTFLLTIIPAVLAGANLSRRRNQSSI